MLLRSALRRSDSWLARARLGAEADRSHPSRCADDWYLPDKLLLSRHGNELLPVPAPPGEAGHAIDLPADHAEVIIAIRAKRILVVARGLDALAPGKPMAVLIPPEERSHRSGTLPYRGRASS